MTIKTREQIQSICKAQWELRGIEPASVLEMQQELSAHLDDALADGKTVTDVVGDDVRVFAASWARERKPRLHRLYRLTLDVSSMAVLLLAFAHLRRWSTHVPVLPGLAVSFAVGVIVPILVERRRGDVGFWKGSLLFLVFGLAGLALNDLVFRGAVLMTVPLWFTAPAALLVIARIAHDMRRRAAIG